MDSGITSERLEISKAGCLSNISLCYKHLQQPGNTIHFATEALNMNVSDVKLKIKAYLRRAYAYEEKDKLKYAKRDFVAIKKLEPGNMDASRGLYRISQALSHNEKSETNSKII